MLIIGAIAFMVVRGMSSMSSSGGAGPSSPADSQPSDRDLGYDGTSFPELEQEKQPAVQSDWGLEDGPVQRNAESKKPSTKSRDSDWGLEDVATQKDAKQPAGRFSQPSNAPVEGSNNKRPIRQGDWGIEDVESTPKPSQPKKTVEGDWGLEEIK